MADAFRDYPDALSNTVRIAERFNVTLDEGENYLPYFDVPAGFTLDEYFEHVVRQGFKERLPRLTQLATSGALRHTIDEYERRLSYEIQMIKEMKYPGYFLIVWDFIRYAREHDIPVGPGRGSAAGSLVAYALRITDIDPLEYNLLFERFLNPERVTMPDIDIDFCMDRRDEVIRYVTEKYGAENVSQIITFGSMLAKGALRDVGRALDMPYNDVDRIAKLLPNRLNISLAEALDEEPRLRELQTQDPRVERLIDTARRLEGLSRHASVHAAGVVISPEPLHNSGPLSNGAKGEVVTQYAMDHIEAMGLLKMDFLGLRTLTVIHNALKLIKETEGM